MLKSNGIPASLLNQFKIRSLLTASLLGVSLEKTKCRKGDAGGTKSHYKL